jgi:Tfp pilus assembly protein PilX
MVSQPRAQERGAAIFIVVMVIALLTAVGLFAARAASLTDVAAGFDRQSLQALALAEYAGKAATAQIGSTPSGYVNMIWNSQDRCQVNERITDPSLLGAGMTRVGCYNIYSDEIRNAVSTGPLNVANLLEPQTSSNPGSLGPVLPANPSATDEPNSFVDGVFKVELTDAFQKLPPARMDQAANQYRAYQITLTAFAQIRNLSGAPGAANPWCSTNMTSTSANVQAVRAFVSVMSE